MEKRKACRLFVKNQRKETIRKIKTSMGKPYRDVSWRDIIGWFKFDWSGSE
jgi:hypothetical protein